MHAWAPRAPRRAQLECRCLLACPTKGTGDHLQARVGAASSARGRASQRRPWRRAFGTSCAPTNCGCMTFSLLCTASKSRVSLRSGKGYPQARVQAQQLHRSGVHLGHGLSIARAPLYGLPHDVGAGGGAGAFLLCGCLRVAQRQQQRRQQRQAQLLSSKGLLGVCRS